MRMLRTGEVSSNSLPSPPDNHPRSFGTIPTPSSTFGQLRVIYSLSPRLRLHLVSSNLPTLVDSPYLNAPLIVSSQLLHYYHTGSSGYRFPPLSSVLLPSDLSNRHLHTVMYKPPASHVLFQVQPSSSPSSPAVHPDLLSLGGT